MKVVVGGARRMAIVEGEPASQSSSGAYTWSEGDCAGRVESVLDSHNVGMQMQVSVIAGLHQCEDGGTSQRRDETGETLQASHCQGSSELIETSLSVVPRYCGAQNAHG